MRKKNVVWVIPQMVCMTPQPPPPRPGPRLKQLKGML